MAVKKKIPPRKRQRRRRDSGGLSLKRGYYNDVDTGEKVSYTYWHASREVDPKDLPAGSLRKRISGNGATEREAQYRLEENWKAFHFGTPHPRTQVRGASTLTLAGLYEKWQEENRAGKVSDTMARKYQGYFANHILPELGAKKLSLLTERSLLFHFYEFLPKKRNLKTGEVLLQGAARRNIFMALSGCLSYGVRHDLVRRNVLQGVPPPKKKPPEDDIETFSAHARDLILLLEKEGSVDYCRWLLQFLGLRRAERLGLSWKNISGLDTENAVMTIRQQLARTEKKEGEAKREDGKAWYVKGYTKTESVRRIVLTDPFLSALREQKKRQDKYKKAKKWKPKKIFADLIFLQEDGSIYTLNRDNEEWKKLLASQGFPHWRGHLNRHITATWLAEQSPAVPMGTVRSILGHESEAMTYYYAKTTQTQQTEPLRQYGSALMKKNKK